MDKLHLHHTEHHHSGLNADRDYISSPGYDTSSTAPASSPDLGDYNYESSVQEYKSRPAPRVVGGNFSNFYGSSSTSSLSKDSTPERSLDHVPTTTTPSVAPAAKRPSLTKIENRLLNFEIKGSSQEEKVVSQIKKDLPKVDVLKRREMFEKEASLSADKLPTTTDRLSNDFAKGISIRERLTNLEKRDDVKDAEIKKINRMSGDFGSVKDRLTTIEKPIEFLVERKKPIDVPVVSIKDRLSSLHHRPDANSTANDETAMEHATCTDRDDSGILTEETSASTSSSFIVQEVSIESVNLVQQLINDLVIKEPIDEIIQAPIVVPDVVPQPSLHQEMQPPPSADIYDESIFNSPEPNSLEQESSVSANTSIVVVSHKNNQTRSELKSDNGTASAITNTTNPLTQSIHSVVSVFPVVQVVNPCGDQSSAPVTSPSPVVSVTNVGTSSVLIKSPKNDNKCENVVFQSPQFGARKKPVPNFPKDNVTSNGIVYEDSPTMDAKGSTALEVHYVKVTEIVKANKLPSPQSSSIPSANVTPILCKKLTENVPQIKDTIKVDIRSSIKLEPIINKSPIYENVVFSQQQKQVIAPLVELKPTTIYNLTTNELIQVSHPMKSTANDNVAVGFLASSSAKLKQITADLRNVTSTPIVESSEAKNKRLKCQIVGVLEKNKSQAPTVVTSPLPPLQSLPINEAPKTPMSPTPSTKSNGSASRNIFDFIKSNLLNETTQNLLEKSTFYVALSEHTARVNSFLSKEDSQESTASSSEVNRLLDEELDKLM